jgi:hypothetical protein
MELPKDRETLLKLGMAVVCGLALLDYVIIEPALSHWKEQGERIDTIREKVVRGRALKERAQSLRQRWDEMQRTDLPDDQSQAADDAQSAIGRWEADSRIAFTNFAPQWRQFDDQGYETYEIRAAASGDQASLARLLFDLETDKMPVRLNEWELTSRDSAGKMLNLSLRFSFVHLTDALKRSGR